MCILHCLFCGSGSHDHLRCIRLSLERNLLKRSAAQGRGCEMFPCREIETLKKWSVCWRGEWPEVWGSQPTRNNYEISTYTMFRSLASLTAIQSRSASPCNTPCCATMVDKWFINPLSSHGRSFIHICEVLKRLDTRKHDCRNQSDTWPSVGTRFKEQTSEPVKIIATNGLQSKLGGRYLCIPPGCPDLPVNAALLGMWNYSSAVENNTFLQQNVKVPVGLIIILACLAFRFKGETQNETAFKSPLIQPWVQIVHRAINNGGKSE